MTVEAGIPGSKDIVTYSQEQNAPFEASHGMRLLKFRMVDKIEVRWSCMYLWIVHDKLDLLRFQINEAVKDLHRCCFLKNGLMLKDGTFHRHRQQAPTFEDKELSSAPSIPFRAHSHGSDLHGPQPSKSIQGSLPWLGPTWTTAVEVYTGKLYPLVALCLVTFNALIPSTRLTWNGPKRTQKNSFICGLCSGFLLKL
ncbi:hypothetical protein L2E82_04232 [Cichorium intybus]|uniref:Uncharacterized protein n=1 Tax=Cichorium intybus TaxID=13427 RepID=A0ACB9H542_CICIN|nr:hypothetical protein L2E82_04232 [Cichorium intybus]